MSHPAYPLRRAALLLGAAMLALAACAPPAATPDTMATSDAMHMAETQTAMDDMHMAETQTAMDAMHMAETQMAMDEMHMAETQMAMDEMHMAETQMAMDEMHMAETQTAMEAMEAEETAMAPATLSLDLSGLEDLGEGWTYAGWLIVAGEPLALGAFTVDGQGQPSTTEFSVPAADLAAATTVMVTIEPEPDDDMGPSMLYLLAGDFDGDEATLTTSHAMGLEGGMTDTSAVPTPEVLPSLAQMGLMGMASR